LKFKLIVVFIFILFPWDCFAVQYNCSTVRKTNGNHLFSGEEIVNEKYSVFLEETNNSAIIYKCLFPPSKKEKKCDLIKVDKIHHDFENKLKKYYYFKGHYDFQLFGDLVFIENNGRGEIRYGKCVVISP